MFMMVETRATGPVLMAINDSVMPKAAIDWLPRINPNFCVRCLRFFSSNKVDLRTEKSRATTAQQIPLIVNVFQNDIVFSSIAYLNPMFETANRNAVRNSKKNDFCSLVFCLLPSRCKEINTAPITVKRIANHSQRLNISPRRGIDNKATKIGKLLVTGMTRDTSPFCKQFSKMTRAKALARPPPIAAKKRVISAAAKGKKANMMQADIAWKIPITKR